MLTIEEYIHKRKVEDGINEKIKEKRLENLRICTNYIFEYFVNYMDSLPEDEKTILLTQKKRTRKRLLSFTTTSVKPLTTSALIELQRMRSGLHLLNLVIWISLLIFQNLRKIHEILPQLVRQPILAEWSRPIRLFQLWGYP